MTDWVTVRSSVIKRVEYDSENHCMHIDFRDSTPSHLLQRSRSGLLKGDAAKPL